MHSPQNEEALIRGKVVIAQHKHWQRGNRKGARNWGDGEFFSPPLAKNDIKCPLSRFSEHGGYKQTHFPPHVCVRVFVGSGPARANWESCIILRR
jgi:hypothetical protein